MSIEIANPTVLSPRGVVSVAGTANIAFADSAALDAFGRLRVSMPNTLFDSQQEYGLDTLRVWAAAANGTVAVGASDGSVTNGSNAVGPRAANTRLTPITVSTTNGHYSILQSRQYTRYIPGKSHLVLITGVFATGSGASMSFVRRSSTSGSVVDTSVAQASWNIDKMDGTGPSGITLDPTKTQILFISAQWLGVGRVVVGFDIDGQLYPCHEFLNANSLTVPYTQSFNLPVRLEARNTGGSTCVSRAGYFDSANGIFFECSRAVAGGTINFVCCSVMSEGGSEQRGFPNSSPAGIVTIGVTTRRPVLSIRPKATFNGLTNRAHIEALEFALHVATNDCFYEIVVGGTLTGAAFGSVGTNSVAEYDTTATAIANGESVVKGFGLSGAGVKAALSDKDADLRSPIVLSLIDALTATQTTVSLVCTAFTGTSNVTPVANWHEQVV